MYRGDSLKSVCEKLNIDYSNIISNIPILLERLFMVGEKGKRYFQNLDGFEINNTEYYVFDKIMKYFEDSLKNKNPFVAKFFERNKDLKEFFSNRDNKKEFVKIIAKLNNRDKLAVRNYYLILLHQLSAVNYKDKSHFVSTSSNYGIAKSFAESKKSKADRIIIHCWQPVSLERKIAQKYGLPTYKIYPYPYQREITILGGIFPHFIMGIEIEHSNKFYPNPNIFKKDITKDTFLYGLDIDQSNFDDVISSTNYKKMIVSNGLDIWEENTLQMLKFPNERSN